MWQPCRVVSHPRLPPPSHEPVPRPLSWYPCPLSLPSYYLTFWTRNNVCYQYTFWFSTSFFFFGNTFYPEKDLVMPFSKDCSGKLYVNHYRYVNLNSAFSPYPSPATWSNSPPFRTPGGDAVLGNLWRFPTNANTLLPLNTTPDIRFPFSFVTGRTL